MDWTSHVDLAERSNLTKSQSPEQRSGLRDTKRRSPNTYYDKRRAWVVKKL